MWATHVDRTAATCRLLSRSFVWMASYTRPTEAQRIWIEQMRPAAALVVGVRQMTRGRRSARSLV